MSNYGAQISIRLNEVKLQVNYTQDTAPSCIFLWQYLANSFRSLKLLVLIGSWKISSTFIVPKESAFQRWGNKSMSPYQASRGFCQRSTGIPFTSVYLIVIGCTVAPTFIGASKSEDLKGDTLLPSLLVPSGKSISLSNSLSRFWIKLICFKAWFESRWTKIVFVNLERKPKTGHFESSDLAMKRPGIIDPITMISKYDIWFAIKRVFFALVGFPLTIISSPRIREANLWWKKGMIRALAGHNNRMITWKGYNKIVSDKYLKRRKRDSHWSPIPLLKVLRCFAIV